MTGPTRSPELTCDITYDRLIASCGLPRLEARALLEHCCAKSREWLVAHGDESVPTEQAQAFIQLAARRRDRQEPLAYLLGWREFHGRAFSVSAAVLIPRPETELLVDLAIQIAEPQARLLDLGTGSGCIAITIACERMDLKIIATDRSPEALAQARSNAEHLCPDRLAGNRLEFRIGDWWQSIANEERFDLIISNPPYIAAADPHLGIGDLRFEPPGALASGDDGLDSLRTICAGAPSRLNESGTLLVEHGYDQAPAVQALMRNAGLDAVRTVKDAAGLDRITIGTWRQSA